MYKIVLLCIYFFLNGVAVMYVFEDRDLQRKGWLLKIGLFLIIATLGAISGFLIIGYYFVTGVFYWFKVQTQIKLIWAWYFTDKYKVIDEKGYLRMKDFKKKGELIMGKQFNLMERVFIDKVIERFEKQNPNYEIPSN